MCLAQIEPSREISSFVGSPTNGPHAFSTTWRNPDPFQNRTPTC